MSVGWVQGIGRVTLTFFQQIGCAVIFLLHVLSGVKELVFRPSLLIREMYSVGVRSLLIILFSGLFVGMVLSLLGYVTLVDFGAEGS
ncbi:MAG: ABC transporter permease, partial [Cocleimonas sp.]|nr:ABC transporter permease [Cocleimonas sp.]